MTTSRRVLKAEKPRPLKISTLGSSDNSMEAVLSEMDVVSQHLTVNPSDRSVYTAIISLCENLKMFGPQLENVYKDQLDRCYVSLRNGCRDDNISLASRYRLLEVIELRAMHWLPNENLIHYYKQKLSQIEAEENAMDEQQDVSGYKSSGVIMTPTIAVSPKFPPSYSPYANQPPAYSPQSPPQQMTYANSPVQQKQHLPQSTPQSPPTLAPGEIIKSSGKFTKPTRIPGKNFCKDEVVIRNPDSGKVMGLKGRRVHMIEELSETIISFQRVSPGARERLVQITGPNEENISQAKQLIEETIRRNSSPVRTDNSMFNNVGGDSSSISSHTSDDPGAKRNIHGVVTHEEPLTEYRYTVVHNDEVIRITGSNLDLVRTSKLILDEYFNSDHNLSNDDSIPSPHLEQAHNFFGTESSSAKASPSADSKPEVRLAEKKSLKENSPNRSLTKGVPTKTQDSSHHPGETADNNKGGVLTVVRQPLIPTSPKEAIGSVEKEPNNVIKDSRNRRALFAKTSEERSQQSNDGDACSSTDSSSRVLTNEGLSARQSYKREFLVKCAASPLSRRTPNDWSTVIRLAPMVVKKGSQFLASLLAQMNEKGDASVNNVQTYLKDWDCADSKALLSNTEYHWTILRYLSCPEDEDNGNT